MKGKQGFQKGHNPFKGIEKTQLKKGNIPWNKGTKGVSSGWPKGKKQTEAHIKKGRDFQLSRGGETSANWKGGITKLEKLIRNSFKYRQWRSDVFTRDDFTCQDCGKRGGYLEAHHLKRYAVILIENNITTLEQALGCEELWNINNGQTLCRECHRLNKKNEKEI